MQFHTEKSFPMTPVPPIPLGCWPVSLPTIHGQLPYSSCSVIWEIMTILIPCGPSTLGTPQRGENKWNIFILSSQELLEVDICSSRNGGGEKGSDDPSPCVGSLPASLGQCWQKLLSLTKCQEGTSATVLTVSSCSGAVLQGWGACNLRFSLFLHRSNFPKYLPWFWSLPKTKISFLWLEQNLDLERVRLFSHQMRLYICKTLVWLSILFGQRQWCC